MGVSGLFHISVSLTPEKLVRSRTKATEFSLV